MTGPGDKPAVDRRNFLKGVTVVGAAAALNPAISAQAQTAPPPQGAPRPDLAAETTPPDPDPVTQNSSGGEFMVDVIRSLGFEYISMTPASSFRGFHEAIVDYGKNSMPELLTCAHEEIAVAMAHGYAKMEGKPMGVLAHGTVGLQHAAMAMYNAFCDKVPVYVMIGNIVDGNHRGGTVEWEHSAQDPGAMVRDFTKWDDQPISLQSFAESAVRAYKQAMTPPMAPVLLSLDGDLQENPVADRAALKIPQLPRMTQPQGDSGAVAETAKLLVNAENPVLIADRMARTQAGMDRLVELAELLQCAVVDQNGRTNFPSPHPLNHTANARGAIARADVIVGLELNDFWSATHTTSDRIVRKWSSIVKPTAKKISISTHDQFMKANDQEFQRFPDLDLAISGDGEETLPSLIEAVKQLVDGDKRNAFDGRGKKLQSAQEAALQQIRVDASTGWDSSPITTARLCAEIYEQIRNDDWSLVGEGLGMQWPHRLWHVDKRYRFNGGSGGAGIGYNISASLGGALAGRKYGRLCVSIQGDGDFMFSPGALWTAAHHKIPMLYVMHNNRAYHQEYMYLQNMMGRMKRGAQNAYIGTTIKDPDIDYATVAKGFGLYSEGPISDPAALAPALKRAIAAVKRGQPALLDTIVEAR